MNKLYVEYVGRKITDLSGHRFGMLVAISPVRKLASGVLYWKCSCDCGAACYIEGSKLKRGFTRTCGCTKLEPTSYSKTYCCWENMRRRCRIHPRYRGRNITCCSRWNSFENFVADMGYCPEGRHVIDRIDNNGNYEPKNCRWTTYQVSNVNRRNSLWFPYEGKSVNLAELSRLCGIPYSRLYARLKVASWPVIKAVSTPVRALLIFVVTLLFQNCIDAEATELRMVTASERGTYQVICMDLAGHVAPDAGFDLECVPSNGSVENVKQLRYTQGVKLALVQNDVFDAYLAMAATGNREAGNIIRPLRAIVPLYNEEIYFVARADSPMNYIHEIKAARINAGPIGSGTALTTLTAFQALFHEPPTSATNLSNEDALLKLTTSKDVDVVVIVGGQPMKLLADMKPEAKQLIKLLKFDPAMSGDVLKTYVQATIRKDSYPNLLAEDTLGIAVKAYLVTYDFNLGQTVSYLRRFARSLCQNMKSLQQFGHPKWKDVDLGLPALAEGWSYYPVTERELRSCTRPAPVPKKSACTQQLLVLGLCEAPK